MLTFEFAAYHSAAAVRRRLKTRLYDDHCARTRTSYRRVS